MSTPPNPNTPTASAGWISTNCPCETVFEIRYPLFSQLSPNISDPPSVPQSVTIASLQFSMLIAHAASRYMVAPFSIRISPNAESSVSNVSGSHGPNLFPSG